MYNGYKAWLYKVRFSRRASIGIGLALLVLVTVVPRDLPKNGRAEKNGRCCHVKQPNSRDMGFPGWCLGMKQASAVDKTSIAFSCPLNPDPSKSGAKTGPNRDPGRSFWRIRCCHLQTTTLAGKADNKSKKWYRLQLCGKTWS